MDHSEGGSSRGWWVKPQVPVAVFPARSRTMPPRAPPFHSMKLGFTSPSIMNADAVKVMPSTTLVLPYAASLRRFLSVIGHSSAMLAKVTRQSGKLIFRLVGDQASARSLCGHRPI